MNILTILPVAILASILFTAVYFFLVYFPVGGHQLTVRVKPAYHELTRNLYPVMMKMLRADLVDPLKQQQFKGDWHRLEIQEQRDDFEQHLQELLDLYSRWLREIPYSEGHMSISTKIGSFVNWYNSWKDFMYGGRLMPYIRSIYFWYDWPADGKHLVFPTE
jgi:hypothetical protein